MNIEAIDTLVVYVEMLMKQGFKALHTSDVLPYSSRPGAPKDWTQFPKLHTSHLEYLEVCGIIYDRSSGWFRKVEI